MVGEEVQVTMCSATSSADRAGALYRRCSTVATVVLSINAWTIVAAVYFLIMFFIVFAK